MTPRYLAVRFRALRHLHRQARIVGRTDGGDVIVEVSAVRLVYERRTRQFQPLARCGMCNQVVVWRLGWPGRTRRDILSSPTWVICPLCAQKGMSASL